MGMTSQGLGVRRNAVERESYKRRIKVIGCLGLSRVASQPRSKEEAASLIVSWVNIILSVFSYPSVEMMARISLPRHSRFDTVSHASAPMGSHNGNLESRSTT